MRLTTHLRLMSRLVIGAMYFHYLVFSLRVQDSFISVT
jgi:hypothetical protein